MNFLKSFKDRIFSIQECEFEALAMELFNFQSQNNAVYSKYLQKLGVIPETVSSCDEIPFLPIEFFKQHRVVSGEWQEQGIFMSSGTTGQIASKNYIEDLEYYKKVSRSIFESFYGPIDHYHILALLPSYLERGNSSLVYMVDNFIDISLSAYSGFYLSNYKQLVDKLNELTVNTKKVLLIGVTYALLDLVEGFQFDSGNDNLIVMETGGMKGRRKEMIRTQLHKTLSEGFKLHSIHSEYGMTELNSQAYALAEGKFQTPPWMEIKIRDINDPFQVLPAGHSGGINIIDLSNVATCAFIETKDLGRQNTDHTFEVLGRFDNTEMRGCNLLIN